MRIEHQPVEYREVADHAELQILGAVHHHVSARRLGAGGGDRRNPDFEHARRLDEVPALAVNGAARIWSSGALADVDAAAFLSRISPTPGDVGDTDYGCALRTGDSAAAARSAHIAVTFGRGCAES